MIKGSRAGRRLAFAKIRKALGAGVTAESVSLDKRGQCFAVWSILKPRDAVVVKANPDMSESERASLAQECVTVNYVVVGVVEGMVKVAEGLWTLEVPDYALGRAVEYSGFLHPETIIRDAHRNLLDMPNAALLSSDEKTRFKSRYIKAGLGCFVGEFSVSEDISIGGELSARVRVKTWIDDDRLHDDQIVLCERGAEGDRLGDGVLAPRPLCDFSAVGAGRFEVRALKWRTIA
jgi:hypothetical protein